MDEIDPKEILELLGKEKVEDKARKSIYVSESTWDLFRQKCESVSASRVLEKLMEIFIEKAEEQRKHDK